MNSNNSETPNVENNSEKMPNKFTKVIAIISIIFSLLSLGVTIIINAPDIFPGEVLLLEPTSYVIIRGVSHFPSDHLVLPLEWMNSSRTSVLIRYPTLVLRELDSDYREKGISYRFPMEGEYLEISNGSFLDSHIISSSFSLQPHSVTKKILLFHIENWWDPNSENYGLRFKSGQYFKVYIEYDKFINDKKISCMNYLFDLEIYNAANELTLREEGSYWWDYWRLE